MGYRLRIRMGSSVVAAVMLCMLTMPQATLVYAADNTTTTVDSSVDQTASTGQAGETGNTPAPSEPEAPNLPVTDPPAETPPVLGDLVEPSPASTPLIGTDLQGTPLESTPSTTQTTDASVDNSLDSSAGTGNATVADNGIAGNATSGNALATATLLNVLQSATGLGGSSPATFTRDIYEDSVGDIIIDPSSFISGVQSATPANLSINTTANAAITNTINLAAGTGNATVADNGIAGNATSGNATAILNLINVINSFAATGQSFIGTVNIHGNLNGDILLPDSVLHDLMSGESSATVPGSGSLVSQTSAGIDNLVSMQAASGQATVDHNGEAGNATTGEAGTKLTILNLANKQVTGSKAILVIVNVLGQWVGFIVDAPAGATTATLGTADTSGSSLPAGDHELNISHNAQITNNIVLSAATGDASVIGNGRAGNATSGNATASANIVNVINSNLALSDWFGVVFINVFGSWTGSFGINTSAGELPDIAAPAVAPPAVASAVTNTVAPTTTPLKKKLPFPTGLASLQLEDTTNDNSNVLNMSIDLGTPAASAAVKGDYGIVFVAMGGLGCFMWLSVAKRRRQNRVYSTEQQIVFPTSL